MSKNVGKKEKNRSKKNKYLAYVVIVVILVSIAIGVNINLFNEKAKTNINTPAISNNTNTSTAAAGGDLKILKSEITETAKFYPYKSGDTNIEIFAVKASDGTIRTAFNTCQVCFDSGRGYYKQDGNKLVCQNCGNVFSVDDIEKIRNGCNPIPILKENKSETNELITISKGFIEKNKLYFENWKP